MMSVNRANPAIRLSRILNMPGEEVTDSGTFDLLNYEQSGEEVTLQVQDGRYKVTASNVGDDRFWLSGTVEATLFQDCARCLRPTPVPVKATLGILMEYSPKVELPYLDEGEAGEEVIKFGDPIFNLGDIFVENLLINVPFVVLHDENCKGLCPICGIDLNPDSGQTCPYDTCPRVAQEKDSKNPFGALKNLDLPDE